MYYMYYMYQSLSVGPVAGRKMKEAGLATTDEATSLANYDTGKGQGHLSHLLTGVPALSHTSTFGPRLSERLVRPQFLRWASTTP